MEATLVALVFLHKAYVKGIENMAEKFNKIIVSLWLTAEFNSQGLPLAVGAVQAKFKNQLKAYRNKHGYSEDGERVNISAIDEDPTEMDINLEAIHTELEENRIAREKKKAREAGKKRHISEITNAVVGGGGKKRLLELADNAKLSLSSSSSAGSKEFSEMNSRGSTKKREKSQQQKDEDDEMKAIRAQLVLDKAAEIERAENMRIAAATEKAEFNLKLDAILSRLPLPN
jgi:hypothetical protein